MKVRIGFVTNSSSSSFVISFKNGQVEDSVKNNLITIIKKHLKEYNHEITEKELNIFFKEKVKFINSNNEKEIIDAYFDMAFYSPYEIINVCKQHYERVWLSKVANYCSTCPYRGKECGGKTYLDEAKEGDMLVISQENVIPYTALEEISEKFGVNIHHLG